MPRSPIVATQPPGTTPQVPNTVISSAIWNAAMDDIYQIFNTPQPIAYGGTGAMTASDARTNLGLVIGTDVQPAVGYATTATAAGTTTLTAASASLQYFTGTTTQTVVLPVTSTLVLGKQFRIVNNSTGRVTVQSSGANTIQIMGGVGVGVTFAPGAPGTELILTCIAITGTGTASWAYKYETPTTDWVAYTPTFTGFGTVSAVTIFSRRVGDTLQIRGSFAAGTPTSVQARMTLGFNGVNGGVTSNTTKVPTIQQAGTAVVSFNAVGAWYTLIGSGDGYISFSIQNAGNHGTEQALATTVITAANTMFLNAEVPVTGW